VGLRRDKNKHKEWVFFSSSFVWVVEIWKRINKKAALFFFWVVGDL